MPLADSMDKVARVYFRAVARRPFTYRGELLRPSGIVVSPAIFRPFTCPPGCGGCCPRFSLVYLPSEAHPYALSPVEYEVNGRRRLLFEDRQDDHSSPRCRNLDWATGRCRVHGRQPFTCDFEILRVVLREGGPAWMGTRLFGRGWAMRRTDGGVGAKCEVLPADEAGRDDALRKLDRLQAWASHFDLETWVPEIRAWVAAGPRDDRLELR